MVSSACSESANLEVGEADLTDAFEYLLAEHANIINISYKVDLGPGSRFNDKVIRQLPKKGALLFVPAGNGLVGKDLDDGAICPACLGNPDHGSDDVAKQTVVVGAATRQLRMASYSTSASGRSSCSPPNNRVTVST